MIRGMYTTAKGSLYVVSGSGLYSVSSAWVHTLIGTLRTSSGHVGMADNGIELIVVDGANGYLFTFPPTNVKPAFRRITTEGFQGAVNVCFQDGYFIIVNPKSGQFQISGIYDGSTWPALDFATAESSPDDLVTIISSRRQLWLLGTKTTELWYDSGAADFPFSRYEGAFIEYGAASPFSACAFANTICWLGAGQNADGIVWRADGYQPQRISNHAVELAIQACGDLSTATAYVYQHGGHMFYCLNLPGATSTWCYDLSTGQWHERCYLGASGQLERHRGECYAFAYGLDVVGDYENGNLYALEDATRTDNGRPIKWLRRSPHLNAGMKRMFHSRVQIDCRMGTGIDGAGQGDSPVITMRYSDDFGNTWSTERSRSVGRIGQYATRAYWDRLGTSRARVYEFSGTDPVPTTLLGAEIDVAAGVN